MVPEMYHERSLTMMRCSYQGFSVILLMYPTTKNSQMFTKSLHC